MAFVTNHIQIDGSLNVDGSIYQFNELFTPGGSTDVSLGALTDVSIAGYIGDGYILEYNSAGDYWTQTTAPANTSFRNMSMLDPVNFPFIDGEFTVDVSLTTADTSTRVRVQITPDDTSYTIFYGYTATDGYRTRTISSNIINYSTLYQTDDASRYTVYNILANYPSSDGTTTGAGQPSSDVPATSCVLATIKFRNSGNAAGELIETINWSKLELNATAGGGGGGDVAWASGAVGSNNQLITAAGDGSIVAESEITFTAGELVINGSLNALIRSEFNNINTENTSRSDIEISAINKSIYFGVDPCITGFDTITSYIDNRTGGPFGIMTDGNEQLIVDPDGNVGINTTPSYRLDVDGSIRATEGFITGNFEIVHNTTSDSLDFNYIG